MNKFEEVGRKLDRTVSDLYQEVEKLRDLAEKKLKPETRAKAARSLRSVSEALQRYAEQLESRAEPEKEASQKTPNEKKTGA